MTTTEKSTRCPCCGNEHELITGMNYAGAAKDGDVTVCINCAEPLWLDSAAEGGMRAPTPAEREELMDVDVVTIIREQIARRST